MVHFGIDLAIRHGCLLTDQVTGEDQGDRSAVGLRHRPGSLVAVTSAAAPPEENDRFLQTFKDVTAATGSN